MEIRRRGDNFRVIGVHAESAEDTLRELFDLAKNEEVTPERVHLTLQERESGQVVGDPQQHDNAVRVPRGGYPRPEAITNATISRTSANGI